MATVQGVIGQSEGSHGGGTATARQSLRIVMVLGALVTLVGGTGIFAVFSDQATTGPNGVGSGPRAHAADLQISEGLLIGNTIDCDPDQDGAYDEDLTTGIFGLSDIQPDDGLLFAAYVCLHNAGSGDLALTASVIDVVDQELSCTGDEEAAGDATCGGFQAGELASVLALQIADVDCGSGVDAPIQSNSLLNWPAFPVSIPGSLAPGAIACLQFLTSYPETTPETSIQLAQSDQVQWRFAFDGTALE